MRRRSSVEEPVLTVTTTENDKGLLKLSALSSRRVPDCLRMVIQEEDIVPKVHD
jgi:hypothetical protein